MHRKEVESMSTNSLPDICWLSDPLQTINGHWEESDGQPVFIAEAAIICKNCGRKLSDLRVEQKAFRPVTPAMQKAIEERCIREAERQSSMDAVNQINDTRRMRDQMLRFLQTYACQKNYVTGIRVLQSRE